MIVIGTDIDPRDWYWAPSDVASKVFSSARGAVVSNADATYLTWVSSGGVATTGLTIAQVLAYMQQVNGSLWGLGLSNLTPTVNNGAGPFTLTNPMAMLNNVGATAATVTLNLPSFAAYSAPPIGVTVSIDNTGGGTNKVQPVDVNALNIGNPIGPATILDLVCTALTYNAGSGKIDHFWTGVARVGTATIGTYGNDIATIGNVSNSRILGNLTGGSTNVQQLTPAQVSQIALAGAIFVTVNIDLNQANHDNQITLTLPSWATRYQVQGLKLTHPSATGSTATVGAFTGAGGTGATLINNTAVAFTSTAENTAGNLTNFAAASATASFNATTIFIRTGTAAGGAQTCDATLIVFPVP